MHTDKLHLLANAMGAYSRRMNAVSANIANLDTPDYRRLSVSFEDRLQEVIHSPGGGRKAGSVTSQTKMEADGPVLEDELMDMADTQMRNQLAARALHEHFGLLRTGITGRTG